MEQHYSKRVLKYFKKELIKFFGSDKMFKVVSLQINVEQEYSVKITFYLIKEETRKLLSLEKEFTILYKDTENVGDNIRGKANIRLKNVDDILELEKLISKEGE